MASTAWRPDACISAIVCRHDASDCRSTLLESTMALAPQGRWCALQAVAGLGPRRPRRVYNVMVGRFYMTGLVIERRRPRFLWSCPPRVVVMWVTRLNLQQRGKG